METSVHRLHAFNVAMTALGTVLAILATLWLFAKPFVARAVASELKEQVTEIVRLQMEPMSSGLRGLIRGNIVRLNDAITELEFKKAQAQESLDDPLIWTLLDERLLKQLKEDLRSQMDALEAMTQATAVNNRSHP